MNQKLFPIQHPTGCPAGAKQEDMESKKDELERSPDTSTGVELKMNMFDKSLIKKSKLPIKTYQLAPEKQ